MLLAEVIEGCKRERPTAQKELYNHFAPVMRGIVIRYAKSPDEVSDIVQEGFIKVFTRFNQYEGKGSFEGWMKRIFINTAITFLKKRQIHAKHLLCETLNAELLPDSNSFYQEEAESYLCTNLSAQQLLDILYEIPDHFRVVFSLHCVDGFKHEQIADMLGIDVVTSRTRLNRARLLLRKRIDELLTNHS